MATRLRDLGWESVMAGMIAVLSAMFLPIIGGLLTPAGELVATGWLLAGLNVVFFGAALIGLGYGLLLIVEAGALLARLVLRWHHSRVWRR